MQLTGLTVEQVIEKLQRCNPKAIVVVPAGEGTVGGVSTVKAGVAYDFLNKEPAYGMSRFNFDTLPGCANNLGGDAVEAVSLE